MDLITIPERFRYGFDFYHITGYRIPVASQGLIASADPEMGAGRAEILVNAGSEASVQLTTPGSEALDLEIFDPLSGRFLDFEAA